MIRPTYASNGRWRQVVRRTAVAANLITSGTTVGIIEKREWWRSAHQSFDKHQFLVRMVYHGSRFDSICARASDITRRIMMAGFDSFPLEGAGSRYFGDPVTGAYVGLFWLSFDVHAGATNTDSSGGY